MLVTVLISVFLSMFEFHDTNLKMQIALVLNELCNKDTIAWIKDKLQFFKRKHVSVPDSFKNSDYNPLFDKLQSYIAVKYARSIESCELIPKNGDVEFDIKDMTGKKFQDTYTSNGITHTMELHIEESTSLKSSAKRQIVISSNTASPDDIKNYVRKVSQTRLNNSNFIKIYRPASFGKKNDKSIRWECVTVRTNKTQHNTIYSDEINKELFDDVDDFMNNEDKYAKRGTPYTRGYFLYSNPGNGKTSIAKILANKYGIPIFCLDLTIVDNNLALTKLTTEINYFINNEKYILLMEDAERADFFNRGYNTRITMDCFLNVIDGVVEPHGRIVIMTANDPENILQHKALMRAGRIDKILEIKDCNADQMKKLFELFYSDNYEINWDCWKLDESHSAAYVMKILQENLERPEIFLRLLGTKVKNLKNAIKSKNKDKAGSMDNQDNQDLKDNQNQDNQSNDLTEKQDNQSNDLTDNVDNVDNQELDGKQDDSDNPDDELGEELDPETIKQLEAEKQKRIKIDSIKESTSRGSRHRKRTLYRKRGGVKYINGSRIEDKVKNAKKSIKVNTKRVTMYNKNLEKTQAKLTELTEKLNKKKERERIAKLKEKAKKKASYINKLKTENKTEEMISLLVDEEAYETPSFMLNSIPLDSVPKDVIVTYEVKDDNDDNDNTISESK